MPVHFEKQSAEIRQCVQEVREILKMSERDGYKTRNSLLACYVGTLMMMVSLAHISSQTTMLFTNDNIKAMQGFINSFVAAVGGAIGCLIAYKGVLRIRMAGEDSLL